VGKIKIPYYIVMKGRGYWNPTPKMKALGFSIVRCGSNGAEAWKIASEWNERWQKVRRGDAPALVDTSKLSRDQAEAVRRYPPRSVGAAFQAYIRTTEWEARAASARNMAKLLKRLGAGEGNRTLSSAWKAADIRARSMREWTSSRFVPLLMRLRKFPPNEEAP
jgi:hypothetical protein